MGGQEGAPVGAGAGAERQLEALAARNRVEQPDGTVGIGLPPRAQNDADEIKQALEFPALYQVTGEDPFIASVTRLGETRVDPIGPGRLLATTLFAVEISWARGAWNPAT